MISNHRKFYLTYKPLPNIVILLVSIIIVVMISFLLFRLRTDIPKFNWIIVLIMISIFVTISLIWIGIVSKEQVSDYGNLWNAAFNIKNGNPIYQLDNDYFAKYAYQTGYLIYLSTVVTIFGENIIIVQILNIIFQAIILLMVYLLVVKIFNNVKMARISILLLMIDIDWFALNSQASNQYLATMFFLLALYLIILNSNKLYMYILAGLFLALGNVIRPIGITMILGITFFFIVYIILKRDHVNKEGIKRFLTILVTYVLFLQIVSLGIKISDINEYGLKNSDPEWKFVTGLNYDSSGVYVPELNKLNMQENTRSEARKKGKKIYKSGIGLFK